MQLQSAAAQYMHQCTVKCACMHADSEYVCVKCMDSHMHEKKIESGTLYACVHIVTLAVRLYTYDHTGAYSG